MGLVIKYGIKEGHKPDKNTIKACHESFKGFQQLLVECAKITHPNHLWALWLITRFYHRKIEDRAITYELYLLPNQPSVTKEEV